MNSNIIKSLLYFSLFVTSGFITLFTIYGFHESNSVFNKNYAISIGLSLLIHGFIYKLHLNSAKSLHPALHLIFMGFSIGFPGLGPIIMILFMLAISAWLKDHPDRDSYVLVKDEEDFFQEASMIRKPRSITEILNESDNVSRRQATLSLRSINPKISLPLLRRAVQDSDEEVRLFANNIIRKINETKESTIKKLQGITHPRAKLRLFEEHMDSIHVGLPEDQLSVQMEYKTADRVLFESINEHYNAQKLLKLLKLKVLQKKYDEAYGVLESLYETGYPTDLLQIWEAELAYAWKDWKALKTILQNMNPLTIGSSVSSLREDWLEAFDENKHDEETKAIS